jgi:hypothetical protein
VRLHANMMQDAGRFVKSGALHGLIVTVSYSAHNCNGFHPNLWSTARTSVWWPQGFVFCLQEGSWYDIFKGKFERENKGLKWKAGSSISRYPNDQQPTTLWYHDHG